MSTGSRRKNSRDVIASAARRLFTERGYAGTTVRDIAGEASVDPSLVIRHFVSKEQLFLDVLGLTADHALPTDGPLETLGPRLIRHMLDPEEDVRGAFLALVRASDAAGVGSRLRQAHDELFVAPLADRLEGEDAALRARLAAALVGGLLYSLWIVGDEDLRSTEPEVLVDRYGALLQELLTPTR
ncbi:TetR/AcrR family transcriptional regulator [Desertivibrio insolitus]|uniref:TetR/AcrR family transcriptional regulator n=1 Tax=Herbiconiux sp. SYSU D00978 TaxID=2812562 RepID=UPI001A966723|nr:TetR family transcriptional regulator [Herbiconiux sp. SYSU D00978]